MTAPAGVSPVIYPESDGKPMADNTIQFRWILTLSLNLTILFRGRGDVFAGGNLFWYPVENFPNTVQAPDVFVVFDRPPGDRPSYLQWKENNVPMTVVVEIRSPNDGDELMTQKFEFYNEYGVEEYYVYDHEQNQFEAYLRRGGDLGPQRLRQGAFTSPRLGIRFQPAQPELQVFYPDGSPFLSAVDLKQREEAAQQHAAQAERDLGVVQQRATQAERDLGVVQQRAARMRELTRKALRGQATPDELAELERLTDESS